MRAVLAHAAKGLEDIVQLVVTDYHYVEVGKDPEDKPEYGLQFDPKIKGCHADPVMNAHFVKELYKVGCPEYTGIYSVPFLWDKKLNCIVNNESGDLLEILDNSFNDLIKSPTHIDLFPADLRGRIQDYIQQSAKVFLFQAAQVSKASNQIDYEQRCNENKRQFEELNVYLGTNKFVFGDCLTGADLALFPIIIRHDIVNFLLFRINHFHLSDFEHIMRWIKDVLNVPRIREHVNIEHIKGMSFSKPALNPSRIIPLGDGFVLPE